MQRWRVPPGSVFRWREWDGDYVLYHDQSGDTHFLNAVSARLVECLSDKPMTAGELVAQLEAEGFTDGDNAFPARLDALLIEFHELGLTEPVEDVPPETQPGSSS